MMTPYNYHILLTNDDGIDSPGLWAAAEALSELGEVTVAAPRDQASSTGRSMPVTSDHSITPRSVQVNGRTWQAYAVGGTPAQVVQHAVLEILPQPPDLIVAGINYGENLGHSITISGTIGAALEGAAFGIPAMAVSMQLLQVEHFYGYAPLDFSTTAYFTRLFAEYMLQSHLSADVDVLKIDVPANATPETGWRITRLARHRYYQVDATGRKRWQDASSLTYHNHVQPEDVDPDTDIYTVLFDHLVSVTPLSLDMTSRVDLLELRAAFEKLATRP